VASVTVRGYPPALRAAANARLPYASEVPTPVTRAPLAALVAVLLALLLGCTTAASPSPTPTLRLPPRVPTFNPESVRPATAAPAAPAAPTVTAAATPAATATPAPTATVFANSWQEITPGGDTVCARGDPFRFWVRRGDPSRVVFFMQGGGGCWDYRSCRPGSTLFDDSVSSLDHPGRYDGIFNLARADNPVRDWTFVVVPACSADAFWGDRESTYRSGSGESVTIQHRGFVNARAAADWTVENVPAAERVFVSGCSAGSAGSALLAPYLIESYPDADIEQLGDSLAFVFGSAVDLTAFGAEGVLPLAVPELRGIDLTSFETSDYYAAIAARYPNTTFAQLNSSHDRIQRLFYEGLSGEPGEFATDLRASLAAIHAQADSFRSCTLGGGEHCFIDRDRFYTRAADGVALRDWVGDLALGEDVPNLACDDCDEPETVR
jgi:hypothetical protein